MRLGFAFGAISWLAAPAAWAAEEYDNPKTGASPCVVLTRYESDALAPRAGQPAGRASALFTNICGRTVEVVFCFLYSAPVDGADRSCFGGAVRPGSASGAQTSAAASVTGFDHKWKYLP